MKKYAILILTAIMLISCFTACGSQQPRMDEEQLAQYRPFDLNVIWEKSALELHHPLSFEKEHYYSIAGVSSNVFVARVTKHPQIGGAWYEPTVMVHKDREVALALDAATATLTMRCDALQYAKENEEEFKAWGAAFRTAILCEIEAEIAEQLADQIMNGQSEFIADDEIWDIYQDYEQSLYAYAEHDDSELYVEFRLKEYENLRWYGKIYRVKDDYLIAIHRTDVRLPDAYVVCNDALKELLDQVVGQHSLLFWNDKAKNGVDSFSYQEHKELYPKGTPGVKYEGFVNTDEQATLTAAYALERAKNECTVEWDTTHVAYDRTARIWMVEFCTEGMAGGCQTVYMDEKGITLLIVYGE